MSGLAIVLSQTIIYWTLLILLISWIIIFAILALRPEPSNRGETEGGAYRVPSAVESSAAPQASVLPEFLQLHRQRRQPQALQAAGVASQSQRDG